MDINNYTTRSHKHCCITSKLGVFTATNIIYNYFLKQTLTKNRMSIQQAFNQPGTFKQGNNQVILRFLIYFGVNIFKDTAYQQY